MVVRWEIDFTSIDGNKYHLRIYDANAASTSKVVKLTGGAHPFTTDESDSDDLYTPVRTQSGYIRFIATDEIGDILSDIMPEKSTDRPVILYKKSTNGESVEWMGFLTGEQYSQPWRPRPYELELPVTSVMGAMESIYFTQSNDFTSLKSICDTISAYLPVGVTAIFPKEIDENIVVVNYNFQTYMSQKERNNEGTTNVYDTVTIKEVVEYFCKYFGVSLRENGTCFYFFAHDATEYNDRISSQYSITDLKIKSASNTASFSQAYTLLAGTFDVGSEKEEEYIISVPSNFSDYFSINAIYDSYVVYNDTDDIQAYIEGKRGIGVPSVQNEVLDLGGSSFGQIVSMATTSYDDYGITESDTSGHRTWGESRKAGYNTSWENGFLFRIAQGITECTMLKMSSKQPMFVAPSEGTLFSLYFDIENDMPSNKNINNKDHDAFIRCIYAKIKVGKYWIKSTVHAQKAHEFVDTFYCDYDWSETECECCLALINNKLQYVFGPVINSTSGGGGGSFGGRDSKGESEQSGSGRAVTLTPNTGIYPELKGINLPLPADLLGTYIDVSIEFLAKVYDDKQFMFEIGDAGNRSFGHRTGIEPEGSKTYDYIQFFMKDINVGLTYATNTTSQLTADDNENKFVIKLPNAVNSKYEVTSTITTRRGVQHGTGIAMKSDFSYVTDEYDLIGLQRRAKLMDKPHAILDVTIGKLLQPIDIITWHDKTFAVLGQSIDWRNDENEVKLLALD